MTDELRAVVVDKVRASAPVTGVLIGRDLSVAIVAAGDGLKIYLDPAEARAMAAALVAVAEAQEAGGDDARGERGSAVIISEAGHA